MSLLLAIVAASSQAITGGVSRQEIAVFPVIARGAPNSDTLAAIPAEFERINASVPELSFVQGEGLRRRLGRQPSRAAADCGADLACLASLGARARADRVVLAQAAPGASGVEVRFLCIGVQSRRLVAKLQLDFLGPWDVGVQLRERIFELVGMEKPGPEEPVSATNPAAAAGEATDNSPEPTEASPTELETNSPDFSALSRVWPNLGRTGQEEPGERDSRPDAEPEPEPATSQIWLAAPTGPTAAPDFQSERDLDTSPTGESEKSAALDTGNAVAVVPPAARERSSLALLVPGIGVSVLGILVAGAGGYFALERKSLDNAPASETQLERQDRFTAADRAANRANLLFLLGGISVATGASLVLADVYIARNASAAVKLGRHSAYGSIEVSW